MPAIDTTRLVQRKELSRAFGDLLFFSTLPAATVNASIYGHEALIHQASTSLVGAYGHIFSGAGSGQERGVIAFTPYSASSTARYGLLEVLQGFSPAPSTNSAFEIHRQFSVSQYNEAIDRAIKMLAASTLRPPVEDYSIILGSWLSNGGLHLWTSGASSAPDSWTLTGTNAVIARSNAFPSQGKFSAKLTNGASQSLTFSNAIAKWAKLAGETVHLRAEIYVPTATPAITLKLNWGTGNESSSAAVQGVQTLELLDVEVGKDATQLVASIEVASGASIDVYVGKVWVVGGDAVVSHDLPSGLLSIQSVNIESNTPGQFYRLSRSRDSGAVVWYVDKEQSPAQLVIQPDMYSIEAGRAMMLIGQGIPTLPTADTDNIPLDPETVLMQAEAILLEQMPWDGPDSTGFKSRYDRLATALELRKRRVRRPYYPGSYIVQES